MDEQIKTEGKDFWAQIEKAANTAFEAMRGLTYHQATLVIEELQRMIRYVKI